MSTNNGSSTSKSAIDHKAFSQIERPIVNLASPRSQVIQLVLSGNVGERALKVLAKEARDDLIALGAISDVQISGARDYELSIEVSSDVLDAYGFSLSQLATIVRRKASSFQVVKSRLVTGVFC